MQAHVRFTTLFWAMGSLIDQGESEEVTVIQGAILAGTLFDHLERNYPFPGADFSLLRADDRERLLAFFRALVETVNHRRKFGVHRNGLVLLVAYSMEGIQQCVTSSTELDY